MRQRIDQEMVRRGLVESRNQAAHLIESKRVLVDGVIVEKASRKVAPRENVEVLVPSEFVGRGALKLQHALEEFDVEVSGLACLDVGSSTGGFTDVLLQRGASRVVACDVGTNQIHERIKANPLVEVYEQTDIRNLELSLGPFDLLVCDVSFISTTGLLEVLVGFVSDGGQLVCLVKPQFEVGRSKASKTKGIVTDPELWRGVLTGFCAQADILGVAVLGLARSPIKGASGNVEFLAHLSVGVQAANAIASGRSKATHIMVSEVIES